MNLKKAFTLIELLVVIAIIAILAAILFPVFAQAKLAAKGISSVSNTKQIGLASIIYTNDYDDAFVSQFDDQSPGGPNGWQNSWIMNELPYFKAYGIVKDPTDSVPLTRAYDSGPKFSYVANGILLGSTSGTFWQFHGVIHTNGNGGSTSWYENRTQTQTGINRVAETIMFATRSAATKGGQKDPYASGGSLMEGAYSPWDAVVDNTNQVDCGPAGCVLPGWVSPWGNPDMTYKGMLDRTYGGKSPVVFADGHAKSEAPEQTVNPNGDIQWGQIGFATSNPYAGQWDALRS